MKIKYKKGTPCPSHEYYKDCLKAKYINYRGFIVGTHGENISTIFKHPFTKLLPSFIDPENILTLFGLGNVQRLKIRVSLRKILMRKLPHGWQRKLRYWLGERFYARVYNFLRG